MSKHKALRSISRSSLRQYFSSLDMDTFFPLAIGVLVFYGSIYFGPFYYDGDQRIYANAYRLVKGLNLSEARYLYIYTISGGEWIHFLYIWMASSLVVEKNLAMALSNAALATYAAILFRQWGAKHWIIALLILTNFYFLVLFFPAERLKIGFIFLMLSFIYRDKLWIFILFSCIAVLGHSSLVFIYVSAWMGWLASNYQNLYRQHLLKVLATVIIFLIFAALMYGDLAAKIPTYYTSHNILEIRVLIPAAILLACSIFYSGKIIEPCMAFLPEFIGIFLLGGSRLNMLVFFIFLYYALRKNSGVNAAVMLTLIYFAFKSEGFISNVLENGHAFP